MLPRAMSKKGPGSKAPAIKHPKKEKKESKKVKKEKKKAK